MANTRQLMYIEVTYNHFKLYTEHGNLHTGDTVQ